MAVRTLFSLILAVPLPPPVLMGNKNYISQSLAILFIIHVSLIIFDLFVLWVISIENELHPKDNPFNQLFDLSVTETTIILCHPTANGYQSVAGFTNW